MKAEDIFGSGIGNRSFLKIEKNDSDTTNMFIIMPLKTIFNDASYIGRF